MFYISYGLYDEEGKFLGVYGEVSEKHPFKWLRDWQLSGSLYHNELILWHRLTEDEVILYDEMFGANEEV